MNKKKISKGIGSTFAYIQHGVDLLVQVASSKGKSASKKAMKSDNKFFRAAGAVGETLSDSVGEFYNKYEELKTKKKKTTKKTPKNKKDA